MHEERYMSYMLQRRLVHDVQPSCRMTPKKDCSLTKNCGELSQKQLAGFARIRLLHVRNQNHYPGIPLGLITCTPNETQHLLSGTHELSAGSLESLEVRS